MFQVVPRVDLRDVEHGPGSDSESDANADGISSSDSDAEGSVSSGSTCKDEDCSKCAGE